jgi:hypothetical protein
MPSSTSKDERWRLLIPANTVVIKVSRASKAAASKQLDGLRASTQVAIVGRGKVRRLARRHGVRVAKEYIAIPSLEQPVAITLVAPESLRWFTRSVLTVPSGTARFHGLKWAAIRVVRSRPRLLRRLPVGDRIVIGVRG